MSFSVTQFFYSTVQVKRQLARVYPAYTRGNLLHTLHHIILYAPLLYRVPYRTAVQYRPCSALLAAREPRMQSTAVAFRASTAGSKRPRSCTRVDRVKHEAHASIPHCYRLSLVMPYGQYLVTTSSPTEHTVAVRFARDAVGSCGTTGYWVQYTGQDVTCCRRGASAAASIDRAF